ncbi:MAG: PilZ domain-containing protein [Elusimicrobiales bacterium]|nr:PilZ domain-containing protein [Elusimicrobiales bacterium]
MTHKQERRKHVRLPILHGILEPVEIEFAGQEQNKFSQPAILSDLSAGGMRIIIFLEPPHTKELNMVLNLGKEYIPVKGKIAWIRKKGEVYMMGISFTEISKENANKINSMANDYLDCDIRISLKLPDVCDEKCRAHILCNKPQKCNQYFKE